MILQTMKNLLEIYDIISKLKVDPFRIDSLIANIYKNEAPRIFRYYFYVSKEYIKQIYKILNHLQMNQERFLKSHRETIRKKLYNSESYLPKNSLFKG